MKQMMVAAVVILLGALAFVYESGNEEPGPAEATIAGRAPDAAPELDAYRPQPDTPTKEVMNADSDATGSIPKPGIDLNLKPKVATAAELREAGYDQKLPPWTAGGVVLQNGKPVEDGEALLWKVASRITTARGIPVAREPDAQLVVGRDGRFRFHDLEPGQYLIGVNLPDGTPRLLWTQFDVSKERDEDLIVLGTGTVAGRAWDKDGRPAADWRVRVSHPPTDGIQTLITETRVLQDGSFRIEHLLPATYWVSIDDPSSKQDTSGIMRTDVVKAGEVTEINFGSPDPIRLKGTARFRDGTPVAGPGRIVAYLPDRRMAVIRYDENGAYDHQLDEGNWTFRFDFSHRHRTIHVAGSKVTRETATRDLKLDCAYIRGQVLHGSDIRPQYVRIWPEDGRWQDGDAVTVDAEGRFYIPGVKTGRWHLRAETQTKIDAESLLIEIRDEDGLREVNLRM